LVDTPELELRGVLDFLGLPWSAEMMAFHERKEMVGSPTYAAAARPVNRAAVGRWRRYAELFAPLEARLREVDQLVRPT
jgi:hypothetical protein